MCLAADQDGPVIRDHHSGRPIVELGAELVDPKAGPVLVELGEERILTIVAALVIPPYAAPFYTSVGYADT